MKSFIGSMVDLLLPPVSVGIAIKGRSTMARFKRSRPDLHINESPLTRLTCVFLDRLADSNDSALMRRKRGQSLKPYSQLLEVIELNVYPARPAFH